MKKFLATVAVLAGLAGSATAAQAAGFQNVATDVQLSWFESGDNTLYTCTAILPGCVRTGQPKHTSVVTFVFPTSPENHQAAILYCSEVGRAAIANFSRLCNPSSSITPVPFPPLPNLGELNIGN